VNQFRVPKLLRNRYVLAVVAGFFLAASFPNFGIAGLAWGRSGLIVAAALGTRGAETFRVGMSLD